MATKAYTQKQFNDKIVEFWASPFDPEDDRPEKWVPHNILFFTKGTLLSFKTFDNFPGAHSIYYLVIMDPEYFITSEQLCQIFDDGNHCLSVGSCVQENNYLYITWSNWGHI